MIIGEAPGYEEEENLDKTFQGEVGESFRKNVISN